MKKLSKEQIEKRKKIKSYLLKSLHIVSYILSALFIITFIAVGVQSCNNNKNKNSVNKIEKTHQRADNQFGFKNYKVYEMLYGGPVMTLPMGIERTIYPDDSQAYYPDTISSSSSDIWRVLSLPSNTYILDNQNNFVGVTEIVGHLGPMLLNEFVAQPYYMGLSTLHFTLSDSSTSVFVSKQNSYYVNRDYNFNATYGDKINLFVFSDEFINDIESPLFNYFFKKKNTTNYSFNNVWNYNAFMQYQVGADINNTGVQTIIENLNYYQNWEYNGYLTYAINVNTYQLTLDTPYFLSNGFLFDRIKIDYIALAAGEKVQTLNAGLISQHIINGQNTTLIYRGMRYINSLTGLSLEVNYRNGGLDSTQTYIYYLSTTWVDEGFKTISFLGDLNDYETLILSNANNVENHFNGGYADLGNVFTLISSAFGGLASILSISIMPSITLGILLFIPLVVMIIITIFKLVKK